MNWTPYIDRNREDLLLVMADLFASIGLGQGGAIAVLPRYVRTRVLGVLRPAEAALRRMIFVAALMLAAQGMIVRARAARTSPVGSLPEGHGERAAVFALIDPRKRFDLHPDRPKYVTGPGPRITDMWSDDPIYDRSDLYAYQNKSKPTPEDELSAVALCRRLQALKTALDDIPKQAKRLMRRQAREQDRKKRLPLSPMRPGAPPGQRRARRENIHEILHECHQVALRAMKEHDTS